MSENSKIKRGHMALRNNIREVKLELYKEVSHLEYFLIDVIIDQTIGWGKEIAHIEMDHFVKMSGWRKDHIYIALKNLENKGIIIRKKMNHALYFGLSEDYFGQLLIEKKKKELLERQKKIKVVVDNSKNKTEILSNSNNNPVQTTPESCPNQTEILSNKMNQLHETMKDFGSLKKCIKEKNKESLKESDPKPENRESVSHFSGIGNGIQKPEANTPEEAKEEKLRQFRLVGLG